MISISEKKMEDMAKLVDAADLIRLNLDIEF